jgi:hypothetical protein
MFGKSKSLLLSPSTKRWQQIIVFNPMRLKARGLVQHGGPPGWLEESNPAGVILYKQKQK